MKGAKKTCTNEVFHQRPPENILILKFKTEQDIRAQAGIVIVLLFDESGNKQKVTKAPG